MHRQLGDGPLAPDCRHRHLRLERRAVLLPCPLHVLLPRYPRFLRAGLHLSHLSHFRGPAHYSKTRTNPTNWDTAGALDPRPIGRGAPAFRARSSGRTSLSTLFEGRGLRGAKPASLRETNGSSPPSSRSRRLITNGKYGA